MAQPILVHQLEGVAQGEAPAAVKLELVIGIVIRMAAAIATIITLIAELIAIQAAFAHHAKFRGDPDEIGANHLTTVTLPQQVAVVAVTALHLGLDLQTKRPLMGYGGDLGTD